MAYFLRESVIKTTSGKVKFRQLVSNGANHYHLGVWLATSTTEERDAVSKVDYLLHPSFTRQQRSSANRANDFSITFWAWGAFEIVGTVHFIDESRPPLEIRHQLNVRLPQDTGDNYERVD